MIIPPIKKPLKAKNNSTPQRPNESATLKRCARITSIIAVNLRKSKPKFLFNSTYLFFYKFSNFKTIVCPRSALGCI